MLVHVKTKWLDEEGYLGVGCYIDGTTAWQIHAEDGEPLIVPTVCLVDYGFLPAPGNVFIKNYSENEGILECLTEAGIILKVGEKPCPPNPVVHFDECKVLIPSLLYRPGLENAR